MNLGGGDALSPNRIRFEAGEQLVPTELADHWFLAEMGERVPEEAAVAPAGEIDLTSETVPVGAETEADEGSAPDPSASPGGEIDPTGQTEADGVAHIDTVEEASEKSALRSEAEALGVIVDGRWGVDRIRAEISAKKAALEAPAVTGEQA